MKQQNRVQENKSLLILLFAMKIVHNRIAHTTLFQPQIESPGISSVKRGAVVFVRKQISSISNAKKARHAMMEHTIFIHKSDGYFSAASLLAVVVLMFLLFSLPIKAFFFAFDSRSNRCYRVVVGETSEEKKVNIISKSQQFQFGSSTDQIHFSQRLFTFKSFKCLRDGGKFSPARVNFFYLISRITILFFLLSLQQ